MNVVGFDGGEATSEESSSPTELVKGKKMDSTVKSQR